MIRRFFRYGLVWLIVIVFAIGVTTDFFSKPKRVTSTTVSNDDNPFANKGKTSNKGEKVAVSEPPTPVDPNAVILTGKLDHTLVEILRCTGNGAELTIEGTLLNQGTDGVLRFYVGNYSDTTQIYDDYGNRIISNYIQVANLNSNGSMDVKLISGVTVKFLVRFSVPTVGGETQTKMVKVLQLATNGFQAEFRNIKVDRVNKNPTGITTPSPSPSPGVATPTPNPSATPKE